MLFLLRYLSPFGLCFTLVFDSQVDLSLPLVFPFFVCDFICPLDFCLSFVILLFTNSFRFGYQNMWDEIEKVCFIQMAWEQLLWDYLFLTTTTMDIAKGKSACGV
jgi:hypothetical protein